MIRFSAFLVAVAVGLLVAGVVTSRLLLVYMAIGVSGVALLALGAGAAVHRRELFGRPAAAGPAAPVPRPAAPAPGQPGAGAPAGVRLLSPAPSAEPEAQRMPESAVSALSWQGPLSWSPRSAPVPQRDAPGGRPGPGPAVPGPAMPQPAWPPPAAPAGPASAAAETSVDLPAVPAAAVETSVDLPAVPAAAVETSVDLPAVPAAAAETSVDLPAVAAGPDAGTNGDVPEAPDATAPPAAPQPSQAPDTGATPDERREVTVVPGVPRYHDAHCILIRFMGEDDLEKTTLAAARDAGCTPCRACLPDRPDRPDGPDGRDGPDGPDKPADGPDKPDGPGPAATDTASRGS